MEPGTLILVCCHAIFTGESSSTTQTDTAATSRLRSHSDNPFDPSQWLLAPFQAKESPTFIQHVQAGIELLQQHQDAILCFSGGATKRDLTLLTEAESYSNVARHLLMNRRSPEGTYSSDEESETLMNRMFEEKWATDSFQNVLFAVLGSGLWRRQVEGSGMTHEAGREQQVTSREFPELPKRLIIVSHEFKRARFLDLHLPAIRELLSSSKKAEFDAMEVEYIGLNPPFSNEEKAEVEQGERLRGYQPWVEDHFGKDKFLAEKRRARGWDERDYLKWVQEEYDDEDDRGSLKCIENMVRGVIPGEEQ